MQSYLTYSMMNYLHVRVDMDSLMCPTFTWGPTFTFYTVALHMYMCRCKSSLHIWYSMCVSHYYVCTILNIYTTVL